MEKQLVFYFKISVSNELEGGLRASSREDAEKELKELFRNLENFKIISLSETTEEAISELLNTPDKSQLQ